MSHAARGRVLGAWRRCLNGEQESGIQAISQAREVPDSMRRAMSAYGEVMDLAISLGGTITGEHGVGRMKRPWLEAQVGPDVVDLNRRIKQALDPAGIMNPGAAY